MKRMARVAALAVLTLLGTFRAPALQVTPLDDNTVSVVLQTRAKSRAEAEQKARREAVLAASGRVLLTGRLIRADELMEKYLAGYASNFVKGVEVLGDQYTGGDTVLDARVFVDYRKLVADLEEKRFLYTPAYKPQYAVFMEERLDDQKMSQEVGRVLLRNSLQAEGMKPYTGTISDPPQTVDVAEDPLLLQAALVSAERRNVELVVTGECSTQLREQRKIYYDSFFFYDCEMKVKVIRVDTGEVFFETSARNAASAREQADAVRLAIERTAKSVADQVDEAYKGFWPSVVQAKGSYEVLLTATDDELTRIVSEQLKRLGTGTEISLKKKFDRTAVLTIRTSARREELLEVLRSSTYPALTVVGEEGQSKFEVQVAG